MSDQFAEDWRKGMSYSRSKLGRRLTTGALVWACVTAASGSAFGTSLFWDVGNGTVPSSGNWDTTTFNWSTAAPTYVPAGTAPNTYTDGTDDVTFTTPASGTATATITLP